LKPNIFISHITEEAEIPSMLKERIEHYFLSMVEVFVSSDPGSNPLGGKWLKTVEDHLQNCQAMLILCSPKSITRPWINFEAGAAWVKGIPVAPLCHSGLSPSGLPIPLSLQQAMTLTDARRIPELFALVAKQLGSKNPDVNAVEISQKVHAFEIRYTRTDNVMSALKAIHAVDDKLLPEIHNAPVNSMSITHIPEFKYRRCQPHFDTLQELGLLRSNFTVNGMSVPSGMYGELELDLAADMRELLAAFLERCPA
jgi:hypothetical protein